MNVAIDPQPRTTEVALSNMSLVYTAPDDGRKVYVGSGSAANDGTQLVGCGITGVLNVAYDCDDQPDFDSSTPLAEDPHRPAPEQGNPISRLSKLVQFAKVGLIDGTGNPTGIMGLAAAVYMAEQLWCFPLWNVPWPPLVNRYPPPGNLLVHCWSGRSRSVTVAALFLWYRWGAPGVDPALGSFPDTYDLVKRKVGDPASPWMPGEYTETPPTVGMQEGALQLSRTYSQLFPIPKGG